MKKKKVVKKEPWRCTPTTYCKTIRERSNPDGKAGLNILTYIDMKTGKTTLVIAVHKLSAKDKQPLALNHCPWCGFDFSKRKDWRGDR